MKLKKQKKETKQELKKEENKSKEDVITAKENAKKSKKVLASKEKEKKSKIKIFILTILEWIVSIIEQFISWLISLIGVYGFFIILVVIVLMIAIYGLLHIDLDILMDGINRDKNNCSTTLETYTSDGFSLDQISSMMHLYNGEDKKALQILSMYSDILNRDMSVVLPKDKSSYIEDVKNTVGTDKVIYFLYGFGAIENVGGLKSIPTTEEDLFKFPSKQDSDYAFLGLHKGNVFNGKYDFDGVGTGSGGDIEVLSTEFVSEIKEQYIPEEEPLYENNFMPYGVSTQIGVLSTNYLTIQYDYIENNLDSIMKEYGIEENKEELKGFIHLFASAGAYHSGGSETLSSENINGLLSAWCALWSTTSEIDANRSFDNIKIVYGDYDFTESQMRPYIFGDTNVTISWSNEKSGYFEVNNTSVDKMLWKWVWDNCSNPSYFETTAKVWLDGFQGGDGDSLLYDSSYGLSSYLIGRDLSYDLSKQIPASNGGSKNNCDCSDENMVSSSGGSLSLSSIKKGEINGDWPEETKEKMLTYGWTEYFGNSYSLEHSDESFLGGDSFESWREESKWKVPYQIQYNNNEIGSGVEYAGLSAGSSGSGCAIYMSSYIASALTGDFISFYEMFAALRANGDIVGANFQNQDANSTFEQLGIYWSALLSNNTFKTGGSSKDDCPTIYPDGDTIIERVNAVLDAGGIVGVRVYGGNYTGDKHYFVISERNGDKYKTVSFSKPQNDKDWQTWEFIVGENGCNLPNASEGKPALYFAYKDGIKGSGSGVAGSGEELIVPDEYGTACTYEREIYNINSETHGWDSTSPQGIMRKDAISSGRLRQGDIFGLVNCAITDDRLMVATKMNIGGNFPVAVGDYIDVVFEDGDVWNCIIGDAKGADAPHPWGHNEGKSTVEIIYWDYSRTSESGNVQKKISKIIKVGNYSSGEVTSVNNSRSTFNDDCEEIGSGGPIVHADNATNNISELPGGVVKQFTYNGSQEPDAPKWTSVQQNKWGNSPYEVAEYIYMYDKNTGYRLGMWPKNYDLSPVKISKEYSGFIWPCDSTMQGVGYEHHGADLHAKCYTPIYAVADGYLRYSEWGHTVNRDYWESAYTITQVLDNPITVEGKKVKEIWYGHMTGIRWRVPDGSSDTVKVKKGDLIAWLGFANAPHLHITFDYSCNIMTSSIKNFYNINYNGTRKAGE